MYIQSNKLRIMGAAIISVIIVIALGIGGAVITAMIGNNTTGGSTGSNLLATATPCPQDWGKSTSPEVIDQCSQAKATRSTQEEQRARQTALANPSTPSVRNFTPIVLWPPLDQYKQIKQIPIESTIGGPKVLSRATSVWLYGYVPNATYTAWSQYDIFTLPGQDGHPIIQTMVINAEQEQLQYEFTSTSPRAIGSITITAITKPVGSVDPLTLPTPPHPFPLVGIVHFKSESAQTGLFNLATRQWIFTP